MLKQKSFFILALAVFLLTVLPAFFVTFKVFPNTLEVPVGPYGEGDYYYDRIREIKDGFPFLGNPYFIEHKEEIAPAFFLADWIASVPSLLGFSLISTTLFNFCFWSLFFVLIFSILLKLIGVPESWAVGGSVLAFMSSYSFMIRPVSMQIILPFFFTFVLFFVYWWKKPLEKRRIFFLVLSSAFASYLYTYSAQLVIVFFVFSLIYFCFIKDKKFLKGLFLGFVGFFMFMLPFALFTFKQVSNPYYWQTMHRIGLVESYLPIGLFFISGFFVVAVLLSVFCFYRKFNNEDPIFPSIFILGFSFLAVSGSNIITGKELENPQHIERYIIPFLVLGLISVLWFYIEGGFKDIFSKRCKVVFFVALSIVSVSILRYINIYGPLTIFKQSGHFENNWKEIQQLKGPIVWLDKEENEPVVVWANPSGKLINYVSMLSKNYVLFNPSGVLHLLSDEESVERYLIAHYFDLTKEKLISDFRIYAGMGNAVHSWKAHNRKVVLCQAFFLDNLGVNCGTKTQNALSWRGEEYFDNLYDRFIKEIRPNISFYLNKYNVKYVIKDKNDDQKFIPEKIPGLVLYNKIGGFDFYVLSPNSKK